MLVGILSDSHGNVTRVARALAWFDAHGAQSLIHCGDVGDEPVFEALAGREVWFVWGNSDDPTPALRALIRSLGLTLPRESPLTFELDGKRFAVMHGHEPAFERLGAAPLFDYVCHGHTHTRRDERRGTCRIINPGALHRASPPSIALLDTTTDRLDFHDLL
ncbi:MAG: YfcE family phosphodiesterase [Phycisphaerales bacterium]|nr:YfcE family phosphodiesterase [Phycisphaerales bacterium]